MAWFVALWCWPSVVAPLTILNQVSFAAPLNRPV